jgi:hypothetical protein
MGNARTATQSPGSFELDRGVGALRSSARGERSLRTGRSGHLARPERRGNRSWR